MICLQCHDYVLFKLRYILLKIFITDNFGELYSLKKDTALIKCHLNWAKSHGFQWERMHKARHLATLSIKKLKLKKGNIPNIYAKN
jgi:predicted nucleotidyltransferase component of viral defense system